MKKGCGNYVFASMFLSLTRTKNPSISTVNNVFSICWICIVPGKFSISWSAWTAPLFRVRLFRFVFGRSWQANRLYTARGVWGKVYPWFKTYQINPGSQLIQLSLLTARETRNIFVFRTSSSWHHATAYLKCKVIRKQVKRWKTDLRILAFLIEQLRKFQADIHTGNLSQADCTLGQKKHCLPPFASVAFVHKLLLPHRTISIPLSPYSAFSHLLLSILVWTHSQISHHKNTPQWGPTVLLQTSDLSRFDRNVCSRQFGKFYTVPILICKTIIKF